MTVVIKTEVHPYVEMLPRALVRFNAVQHEPMNRRSRWWPTTMRRDFESPGQKQRALPQGFRPAGSRRPTPGRKSSKQYEVTLSMKENATGWAGQRGARESKPTTQGQDGAGQGLWCRQSAFARDAVTDPVRIGPRPRSSRGET